MKHWLPRKGDAVPEVPESTLYGKLYRSALYPLYESVLRGRKTLKYLAEFERTQWLSPDEIRANQWDALKRMLAHAYEEVPFYRRAFDRAGLTPGDVRSRDDFCRVPFLEKTHLQEDQDELIARSFRDKPLITSHSGGSTGQPVEFKFHRDHYDRRCAAWMRADRWAGWELGEPQVVLWLGVGSGVGKRKRLDKWKERLHWAFMRWKVLTITKLSRETIPEYIEAMRRFRPRNIYGLAGGVYAFAVLAEELGLEPPRMKGIILGAEKVFPHQKQKIGEVFRTPVFERYGCQEVCNIGEECDRHNGMHVNADGLIVEVVDENGRPAAPGTVGEVVVTSLDNFAMPFIRYRLGDMGILSDRVCACGRGLPLIKEVLGRTLDTIATPEGVFCSGVMMPHFMKEFSCVKEFQFVQDRVDHLKIRLVPTSEWNENMKAYMERELRRYVGPTMQIEFEESDRLERTKSGKYRMVISKAPVTFGARQTAET